MRLDGLQYRGLARAHHVARPAHRSRRIRSHDLADDQPVEQVPQGGEPLLDAGGQDLASFELDPARHVQRLHTGQGSDAYALTPPQKLSHGPRIGAAGVRVAELRGEKLEKPDAGALADA